MATLFINILAFGTLLSSIFSITSKNPVISVIYLIATFVQAAVYLILIGINFVGIAYIIVYVGAIAVLFLFIIMMINIKLTDILETGNEYTKNFPLAIGIGSLFLFIIFTIIPFNFNNVPALSVLLDKFISLNNGSAINTLNQTSNFNLEIQNLDFNIVSNNFISSILNNLSVFSTATSQLILQSDILITDFQQIEALGHGLYTYGAISLIIVSMILLLAMLSAIIISKSNTKSISTNLQ